MNRARMIGLVAVAGALAGCSVRTASLDDTATIPAPSFAPLPVTPIESPQLDVLQLRETAGLNATEPDAEAALIRPALDATLAAHPGTTHIADLYLVEGRVYLTIPDPQVPGRSIGISYDGELSVSEAEFDDNGGFYPIDRVHPEAITALVDGLIERYPTLQVNAPRLDVGLSYGLGLSWRIELNDARGTLATLWADLDGRVIAVDQADA